MCKQVLRRSSRAIFLPWCRAMGDLHSHRVNPSEIMLQWIQVNTFSQPLHQIHAYYFSYSYNQKVQPSISNWGFSILFMLILPDGNDRSLVGASTAGQWGEEDAYGVGAGTSLLYSNDIIAGAVTAKLINEWWLQVKLCSSLPTNVIESCWAWSAGTEWLLSEGEGGNDCELIAGAVICRVFFLNWAF